MTTPALLTLDELAARLRYGEDAEFEAAMRADAMIEQGDPEGLAVWKRILRAVDELLAEESPKGSYLH